MRVYIPNINFTNPVGKTALCLLQTPEPKRIYKRNRVTICISKAVKSNRVGKLSGNDIRIDESACFGIVITTVKVIKTCLCVVVIAAVTYRVEITDVICSIIIDRKYLTPCVVCITCYLKSRRSVDLGNVTLNILAEVVVCAVVIKSDYPATAVVICEGMCDIINIIAYVLLIVKKNSALSGIPKNSFKCGE